ncbi:MAG: right-handed parallel beta-helix repeat-containing protein [Candidatus Pacebacteria bacterium]|nr:right-handed parallel beta-helix repeat-containing protein [Candidatus Paceibacterota bacterium]
MTFYVATDGSDRWSGMLPDPTADDSDGPFASLSRARNAVRKTTQEGKLRGPVTIALRGGTYELPNPLVLTSDDTGSSDSPVTYSAYRGEKPVLSGGRTLADWRPAKDGLWVANASGVLGGDGACRQLFVNGRRAKRARCPREGFFSIDGMLPGAGKPLRFRGRDRDLNPDWVDAAADVVILQNWYEMRHSLTDVGLDAREATLTGVSSANGQLNPRYFVENAPEGLDEPGSWFFDSKTQHVYYRPLPNEDMHAVEAVVPVLDCLVCLKGEPERGRIDHVRFSNLTFLHTVWTLPKEGYNDRQAAHDISAAIRANWARHCTIDRCRFEHLGGYAVEWTSGCSDNSVEECELTDLGAGGIKIGERTAYEDQSHPNISRANTVKDCEIHDIGHVYPAAVGVWIGHSADNAITGNHICDTYYTGISAGWTWGYGTSNATGNRIEYNRIHHIGRGMLSDMGGIYLLGKQPGTVIRSNRIHDIQNYAGGYGGWGIYLDEGCSEVLVEKNLVYRTSSGGFHQHYGRENVIRNNIFAFSGEGQILRTRQEDHLSFTMERNIVYCDRASPLTGNWSNGQYRLDRNLYYRRDGLGEKAFRDPLVYLGLRPFPRGFLREKAQYDIVALDENAAAEAASLDVRFLGTVPRMTLPPGNNVSAADWTEALILPSLVTDSGDEVRFGETETRLLRAENELYIGVLCKHSRITDKDSGMSNDAKQEKIEIFLKPSVRHDPCVQLLLKADGTQVTYSHPGDAWGAIKWDGRAERTETGWRAHFRIPIAAIQNDGNLPGLWQVFVGRYALLPSMTFRDWQATGQDRRSKVADPLFRSVENDDFTLREDSPARVLGFEPLDESFVVRQS